MSGLPRTWNGPLRHHVTRTILLLALVVPAAGCGNGGAGGGPDEESLEPAVTEETSPAAGRTAEADTAPPTRSALPGLFSIMADLEAQTARLDRGLWAADFDTIAAGASGVADHAPIPPGEAETISGILGPDMDGFRTLDAEVHDLAVRIRTLAGEEQMDSILRATALMRDGCVSCHERFRDRLRAGLR